MVVEDVWETFLLYFEGLDLLQHHASSFLPYIYRIPQIDLNDVGKDLDLYIIAP